MVTSVRFLTTIALPDQTKTVVDVVIMLPQIFSFKREAFHIQWEQHTLNLQ